MPGLEGFLLHPVRIPIERKRTRRRLLSSRLCSVPVHPESRVAMNGMLWRGHANQGRCQPGRRAVLEETKEPSDLTHSTLGEAFSQGNSQSIRHSNLIIYYHLRVHWGPSKWHGSETRFVWYPGRFLQKYLRDRCDYIADYFMYSPRAWI